MRAARRRLGRVRRDEEGSSIGNRRLGQFVLPGLLQQSFVNYGTNGTLGYFVRQMAMDQRGRARPCKQGAFKMRRLSLELCVGCCSLVFD